MSTGGRVIPGGRRNEIEEDEMNGIANVIETEGIESVGRDQEVQVLDERTVITYLSVNQPLLKRTPMRKRKARYHRKYNRLLGPLHLHYTHLETSPCLHHQLNLLI